MDASGVAPVMVTVNEGTSALEEFLDSAVDSPEAMKLGDAVKIHIHRDDASGLLVAGGQKSPVLNLFIPEKQCCWEKHPPYGCPSSPDH